jgi:phosphoglycolate phosphatase
MTTTLHDILARTRYVFIDFDGPVCDLYAGLTDAIAAARLRKIITGQGITGLPARIAGTPDPIAVFGYAASLSPELGALAEAEMTVQETAAAATARPVPYSREVITSARDTGRQVAIVSNNSPKAVSAYLAQHGLADRITCISARTGPDPALLKPSPHLITRAITALSADPAECVLIGDSVTDIQAARHAAIASIGYANKPGKHHAFTAEGATAVITSLADVVLPLRARQRP